MQTERKKKGDQDLFYLEVLKMKRFSLLLVITFIFSFFTSNLVYAMLPEPDKDLDKRIEEFCDFYDDIDSIDIEQAIIPIVKMASSLLQQEEVVLNLNKEVQIVGDIHGDLHSLKFIIFDFFLSDVKKGNDYSILFLGDYVDRGPESLKCMLVLLKLKILYPNNVYLLRGNHETTSFFSGINGFPSLASECQVFGPKGREIYFFLQQEVFDKLPLAAVVFDFFVCIHGGLPNSGRKDFLEALSNLKKPIDSNHSLVFQSLWNDPAKSNAPSFYFGNSPRGNGIRIFGQVPVDSFCKDNDHLMIIRGHETCGSGFNLSLANRVLTVFSSANYCDSGNLGGILKLSLEEFEKEGCGKFVDPVLVFTQFDGSCNSRCSKCIDAFDIFESSNLDINTLMGPVDCDS